MARPRKGNRACCAIQGLTDDLGERMSEDRKSRRLAGQSASASFVPLVLAVAVILVVGVVTEIKSRELARHIQRTGTSIVLEDLRTNLEEAVGDQLDLLSRLAGTMSAAPSMSEARLVDVARSLVGEVDRKSRPSRRHGTTAVSMCRPMRRA